MSQAVYIIAHVEVKDIGAYIREYALPFKPILEKYQGEALVGTTKAEILEGERYGDWTVILKFPSKELAHACINSEEYAPLAKHRITNLSTGGKVIMVPANEGI